MSCERVRDVTAASSSSASRRSMLSAALASRRSVSVMEAASIIRTMNRAPPLDAPVTLLPLSRPLMTVEVLDAAFRLFRAALIRCLPYSGLAVLVLELPTLYFDYMYFGRGDPALEAAGYGVVLLLTAGLLGLITLRMYAVSRGEKPRF